MAYTNHLLFNNVFLKNLSPADEEMAAARYLVHGSARDWFREADLSTPVTMVDTWIKPLLNQQSLDLVSNDAGDGSAWTIVAPWARGEPLALCYVAPHGAALDGHTSDQVLPKGQHWMIRAVNAARSYGDQGLRWAVLTNGEQWRLLDASSLRRYEAFLKIDLYDLLTGHEDPMAAYLFYRLIRLEDSLEREAAGSTNKLDGWLQQSIRATEATERYLKASVSDNLSTPGGGDGIMAQLCMGLVHAIDPTATKVFAEAERNAIYRDATYLLYRLLFILYAEARHLLPMERKDYQAISLESLIDEAGRLRADPLRDPDHPNSLWQQLGTLSSAIRYSDEYLGIPAYNGGLFEDEDKPYLRDYPVANKYLAEALYELAFLRDAKNVQPDERIDYRDLSVRHLGSLYEGMIEYQLFIAPEKLYARQDKGGRVQYLEAAKTSAKPTDEVINPGQVYFAQSSHERKATGTHYTAEDLVERLVQQTVLRLLAERWARFQPKLQAWLAEIDATPTESGRARLRSYVDAQIEAFVREQVLSLRVCDMTVGSGHFLVHGAYAVTNFVLQVLSATPWDNPAINLDANYWRKRVVENCLYGVDVNGMAVELAKLSLWLATMQAGKPLSFLDHHLKRGNSLLGASLDEIVDVLTQSDLNKETRATKLAEAKGQYAFREIPQIAQKIQQANQLLDRIAGQAVERADDIAQQEGNYEAVQELLRPYKEIGDLLVARAMGLKIGDHELHALVRVIALGQQERLTQEQESLLEKARSLLEGLGTYLWELEYPAVFFGRSSSGSVRTKGFDVIIGNPPFLGGMRISGELGTGVLQYLKAAYIPTSGTADLCSYFFRRGFQLIESGGCLGLVATNTIAQGDTRQTGLSVILGNGGRIYTADKFVKWKGDAAVEVNLVALQKSDATNPILEMGSAVLDNRQVSFISSWLDDLPEITPFRLAQNAHLSFQGDILQGIGFLLDPAVAETLIRNDPRNARCLFPYLAGREINENPEPQPRRYAICFHDWSLPKSQEYPDLIQIVESSVRPGRAHINRQRNRERWWLYAEYRRGLREAIKPLERVLVRSRVSELHMVNFAEKGIIYGDATVVFAFDDYYHFALLQSSIHEIWLRRQASTLESRNRYTPTDCFLTFPVPQDLSLEIQSNAKAAGEAYYKQRRQFMLSSDFGMAKAHSLLHRQACTDSDIQEMRRIHVEMDQTILACYGWQDISLEHGYYLNDRKQIRFVPSPTAQREVFTRLITLNQKIAKREAALGLINESDESEEDIDTDEE